MIILPDHDDFFQPLAFPSRRPFELTERPLQSGAGIIELRTVVSEDKDLAIFFLDLPGLIVMSLGVAFDG